MQNYKNYVSQIEYSNLTLSNAHIDGRDLDFDDIYEENPKARVKRKHTFEYVEAKKSMSSTSEQLEYIDSSTENDNIFSSNEDFNQDEIIDNIKEHLKLEVFNLGGASGENSVHFFDSFEFVKLFEKSYDTYSPKSNNENHLDSASEELTISNINQHYEEKLKLHNSQNRYEFFS